ncbi:site-specific integrase [Companilactobacillus sp. HBUAS59699]|uniref:site-specific integrase n=1 Tax=Companilactobacillus sp. HBUAS59699 TaxID=3109358 RepID=UPI002FF166CE
MASIYKGASSWFYRISYYDENKKRKYIKKGGFKRKSDAVAAATEVESKKFKIGLSANDNVTLADYFDEWVNTYKIGKVSQGVENRYLRLAKDVRSQFKDTKLKDIKKSQYQRFIDWVAKDHVKHTVIRTNGSIRDAVSDAIDDGIIYKDFTHKVVITGFTAKRHEINYLNESDINKLKEYCVDNQSIMYITLSEILFALLTGCRYGEVVGLTWDCVNFDDKTVYINKQYDYVHRNGFKPTKTKSSVRTISINNDVIRMLKKLELQQKELFLKQGFKNDKQLVFINNRHEVPTSNGANKALTNALKAAKADRTDITFHGLRHTHASLLISDDISLDYIAERLGHSDSSVTAKVYVHLLKNKRMKENDKAITLLNSL